MKSHLNIKVQSLAAEMTAIHRKEIKWKERARAARQRTNDDRYHMNNFWSLREHRSDLKVEARNTHLAYGFLLGNSYASMEQRAYSAPDWQAIEDMVTRFTKDEPNKPGDNVGWDTKFSSWKEDAMVHSETSVEEASKLLNIPRKKGEHKPGNRPPLAAE